MPSCTRLDDYKNVVLQEPPNLTMKLTPTNFLPGAIANCSLSPSGTFDLILISEPYYGAIGRVFKKGPDARFYVLMSEDALFMLCFTVEPSVFPFVSQISFSMLHILTS